MKVQTTIKPRIGKKDGGKFPYMARIEVVENGECPSKWIYDHEGNLKGWEGGFSYAERKCVSYREAKAWLKDKIQGLQEFLDDWYQHFVDTTEEEVEEWRLNMKNWKLEKVDKEEEKEIEYEA